MLEELLQANSKTLPQVNKQVCEGLAVSQMDGMEPYIDEIWKAASDSFPGSLRYAGYDRCTPHETFRELTRPKRNIDLAYSTTYTCMYKFTFDGKPIKSKFLDLPYIKKGSLMYLRGTRYKVSPILGGAVFNTEEDKIFMWTPRFRMQFLKMSTAFVKNGNVVHTDTVYTPLYNLSSTKASSLNSTIVHYLLTEFGLTGMFKHCFGVDVKVGYGELDSYRNNPDYKVYCSRKLPLSGRGASSYVGNDLRIVIPTQEDERVLDSVIGGIFYIVDTYPLSVRVEDVDNPELWINLLHHFIFATGAGSDTAYKEISTHLDSIRQYTDTITLKILKMAGIEVDNFYGLLVHIVKNFSDILMQNDVANMYDKELTVVKHIAFNIVGGIFKLMFELNKLKDEKLHAQAVITKMAVKLRRDAVLSVSGIGGLSADSVACDCMPYAATCNMEPQSKASSSATKGKQRKATNDRASLVHSSQAEVATYQMMSKSEPSGRGKTNIFVRLYGNKKIVGKPHLEQHITELQRLIDA